ncbi:hypothetical protein FOA52_005781 [Chlamydomonas sp. UWO 241]|nr:hypothetical protein FOA52_005781 [Chlamydomonas sp. UWO 241]
MVAPTITSVLAPSVSIPMLAGASVAGTSLADDAGHLTDMGLCAFWTVISALVCFSLYKGSQVVSPRVFRAYRALTKEDQRQWDVRYASTMHAPLCVYYAYVMILSSDFFFYEGSPPNVFRTNAVTHTALGVSTGFFLVETAITARYGMGGPEMLAHHLGSLASVLTAVFMQQGHMHTMWMLVTECTTPFIDLRWLLDKADMKSTPLYFYNGMAIFIVWIVARLSIFPPFFYVVWQQRAQIPLLNVWSIMLLSVIPWVLLALNLLWFSKILKGVIKLLQPAPKDIKKEH